MKTIAMSNELGIHAKEALTAVLRQVSTIEIKGIEERMTPDLSRQSEFVVQLRVLGRNKTLACKVTPTGESRAVRKALREFEADAARFPGEAIPVIVAPYLPPESRQLCVESQTAFVDFEDNARMTLGDIFIAKRSLPRRDHPAMALPQVPTVAVPVRKFAPARVAALAVDCGLPAVSAA